METKEFKVNVPEGYEIDKENSTFECIKFKRVKEQRWRDNVNKHFCGYYIDNDSSIHINITEVNDKRNHNMFATKKQAKSALAMARISQIMANDERFGGIITNEEWRDDSNMKYIIDRFKNIVSIDVTTTLYCFLAFHTNNQRYLFMKENMDLIKDYLMID